MVYMYINVVCWSDICRQNPNVRVDFNIFCHPVFYEGDVELLIHVATAVNSIVIEIQKKLACNRYRG